MGTNRFPTWADEFSRKLMDPADAVRLIQDGDRVAIPIGSITPNLAQAIWDRRDDFSHIDVLMTAPFLDPGWFEPGHPSIHVDVEIFNTVVGRKAVNEHRAGFITVPFSRRFKPEDERGEIASHVDVTLLGISTPDRFGFCSYGLSMWNKAAFAKRSRIVLAEMFPGYPRTGGANQVHISEIDAIVEGGEPPPLPARERPEFPQDIAGFVNELVCHGDTVQIGTGSMTGQLVVAGGLEGKEDLGIHSEISVPGLNNLVYQGQITGAKKTLHPGKFVATALAATTPEEVEFIHENPVYEVYDVGYTNDIQVIAAHDNMVAINNALAIDLLGQVACETMGPENWSGPGGQPEFAIGALLSKNGRSITLLPSTAKDGVHSRIVPQLEPGTVVTIPRQFVDIVVTEFGIARLFGKNERQRAEELISVAHPDHRAELRKQATKLLGA